MRTLEFPLRPITASVTHSDAAPTRRNGHEHHHGIARHPPPLGDGSPIAVCAVCLQHLARYTCPHCRAPYCSVSCYQTHGSHTNNNCTETFYEQRVTQVLECEVQEKADDMQHILQRAAHPDQQYHQPQPQHQYQQHQHYHQTMATMTNPSTNTALDHHHNYNNDTAWTPHVPGQQRVLSRDELMSIMECLQRTGRTTTQNDNTPNPDEDAVWDRVRATQPLHVQALLQHVMVNQQRGNGDDTLTDWILDPWYPWWRTELVGKASLKDDDKDEDDCVVGANDNPSTNAQPPKATLDERILAIPPFSSLFKAASSSEKQAGQAPPPPALQHNLVELVYSIVSVLRLYQGCENAVEDADAAVESLWTQSKVLSEDARYTSTAHALTCATRTNNNAAASPRHGTAGAPPPGVTDGAPSSNRMDGSDWALLVQDTGLVCETYRLVLRCLLEASDLVQAGIGSSKDGSTANASSSLLVRQQLRRGCKKLHFYMAWVKEHRTVLPSVAAEVHQWRVDWTLRRGEHGEDGPSWTPRTADDKEGRQRRVFVEEVVRKD